MFPDLIYDIGMHRGGDTAFYLQKGFRVVAVEANPELCARARAEFGQWIVAGRLTIVPFAIAETIGYRQFFINREQDDWSSLVRGFGTRGGAFQEIQVPCMPLLSLVQIFGVPYYLKVDIEGLDDFCVQQLASFPSLPRYVSVEATVGDFAGRMSALGYRSFKLIGQRRASLHRVAQPALEGFHAEPAEAGLTSGHFGEETYGRWMTAGEFERELHLLGTRRYGDMVHMREYGATPEQLADEWFDMHARLGG